jgi:hypothetical protein
MGYGPGVVFNQWLLDILYEVKKKRDVMWRPYTSVCDLEPFVGFSLNSVQEQSTKF